MNLKKDNEATKAVLDDTKEVLEQTEFVLTNTRQCLAEESYLRKAHQQTEEKLSLVGTELLTTLGKTVHDVSGLHDKNRRKSDLQSLNRNTWGLSQAQVSEVTSLVEDRVEEFKEQQINLMTAVSRRMQSFVEGELEKLSATQSFLEANVTAFEGSEKEVLSQTESAKEEMDLVLEEIKTLREDVKTRVGEGLNGLSAAAERISAEVINELGAFHTQLHGSYSSLGRDFKTLFEDLMKHIKSQKSEVDSLRQQLHTASKLALESNAVASKSLDEVLEQERKHAATDRDNLLSQITSLISSQGRAQDERLKTKIGEVQSSILSSKETFEASRATYDHGMDIWNEKEDELVEQVLRSRETLKTKLKEDWVVCGRLHYLRVSLTNFRLRTNTAHQLKSLRNLFMLKLFVLWISK